MYQGNRVGTERGPGTARASSIMAILYTPEQVAAYPAVLRPPSQEEQGQRGLRYGSTALPRREQAGRGGGGGGYDVSKGDGHIRHRRRDGNKSCAASVPLGRRERFHSP